MPKGPQLTQRKIDKLRDALNVVHECDQVIHGPVDGIITLAMNGCDQLQNVLESRAFNDYGVEL